MKKAFPKPINVLEHNWKLLNKFVASHTFAIAAIQMEISLLTWNNQSD